MSALRLLVDLALIGGWVALFWALYICLFTLTHTPDDDEDLT